MLAIGDCRPPPERDFRVHKLYGDVFEHVAEMERRHRAVCLVGVYTAQTAVPLLPEAEVAVLALRSRDLNPAAAKFATLFAERRIPAGAVAWDV